MNGVGAAHGSSRSNSIASRSNSIAGEGMGTSPLVLPRSPLHSPSPPPAPSDPASSDPPAPSASCVSPSSRVYSWDEIRQHNTSQSCWLVVNGRVYDVTPMLRVHPAGAACILRNAGTDATLHYEFHSRAAHRLWAKYEIGRLEGYKPPALCSIQ